MGEPSNSGIDNNSYSNGRGQHGRHDNHGTSSHQSGSHHEYQEIRHKNGGGAGSGYHPSSHGAGHHNSVPLQEPNGRSYSNGHGDPRYNDRRTHHVMSHDNHVTSNNNRHHPYQRHGSVNGWR